MFRRCKVIYQEENQGFVQKNKKAVGLACSLLTSTALKALSKNIDLARAGISCIKIALSIDESSGLAEANWKGS